MIPPTSLARPRRALTHLSTLRLASTLFSQTASIQESRAPAAPTDTPGLLLPLSLDGPARSVTTLSAVDIERTGVTTNDYLLNPALAQPPSGHQDLSRLVSLGVYAGLYTSTEAAQSFNRADCGMLLQGSERKSTVVSLDHKLAPDLSIFGELHYARTETFSRAEAQSITATLAPIAKDHCA